MTAQWLRRVSVYIKRFFKRSSRAARLREHDGPVDMGDPMGGALRDAELLVAFAAQSRRSIKKEKITALTAAAGAIVVARAAAGPTPAQCADFWIAYDDLAVDMAPLSAHSIRSSIKVNAKSFPFSLFTPTAFNAALAVLVFFVCLALQGFWVAGKELTERAESLETQKGEIQQRLARSAGALRRAVVRQESLARQQCEAKGIDDCDEIGSLYTSSFRDNKKGKKVIDASLAATLHAEMALMKSEVAEKDMLEKELNEELSRLNDRSRPLENLLGKWHDRARIVCDRDYVKFLCPVDNPKGGADRVEEVRIKVEGLNKSLAASKNAADKLRSERSASQSPLSDAPVFAKIKEQMQLTREIEKSQQELVKLESDRFRSIVVEVRIIVANIGTYLIAMVMGLLGALTFILRSLSSQLREHTYVPVSLGTSVVRICLGAIAGVFGSMLAPGAEPSLKSLPPLFIPFVFGYGIEILFSLLDKVVRSFTQVESPPGNGVVRT